MFKKTRLHASIIRIIFVLPPLPPDLISNVSLIEIGGGRDAELSSFKRPPSFKFYSTLSKSEIRSMMNWSPSFHLIPHWPRSRRFLIDILSEWTELSKALEDWMEWIVDQDNELHPASKQTTQLTPTSNVFWFPSISLLHDSPLAIMKQSESSILSFRPSRSSDKHKEKLLIASISFGLILSNRSISAQLFYSKVRSSRSEIVERQRIAVIAIQNDWWRDRFDAPPRCCRSLAAVDLLAKMTFDSAASDSASCRFAIQTHMWSNDQFGVLCWIHSSDCCWNNAQTSHRAISQLMALLTRKCQIGNDSGNFWAFAPAPFPVLCRSMLGFSVFFSNQTLPTARVTISQRLETSRRWTLVRRALHNHGSSEKWSWRFAQRLQSANRAVFFHAPPFWKEEEKAAKQAKKKLKDWHPLPWIPASSVLSHSSRLAKSLSSFIKMIGAIQWFSSSSSSTS